MTNKTVRLFFILLLVCNTSFAQKLYVWCPDEIIVKERTGFLNNQDINLIVIDGRSLPTNSKVECDSKSIVLSMVAVLKKAYPSCKITCLDESQYYSKSEKGKITIKLAIAAYQAGFGTDVSVGIGKVGGTFAFGIIPKSEWNGLVGYYVQIFDNRSETEKKYQKEITQVTSKSNMWGYKTAKSCLNTSYEKTNQDLLFFIDNSLLE